MLPPWFKSLLFHALTGFIVPLHVLGLRTIGFRLRRVLRLREYRRCKGNGEGQRHSGQQFFIGFAPWMSPGGLGVLSTLLAEKYGSAGNRM